MKNNLRIWLIRKLFTSEEHQVLSDSLKKDIFKIDKDIYKYGPNKNRAIKINKMRNILDSLFKS